MRSQAYAYLSAKVYSSANKGLDPEEYANEVELLKTVFNRGYGDGYLGGVVTPVQKKYADNRGQYLGKATFSKRKFDTDQLDEKVSIRDGLTLYRGDEKVGGFKLTSVGKTASPFSLPDGTYEVYRTYDPRIDTIKNMVGEPPKFTGTTEDQLREQFRDGAIQQVRVSLALSALAREQGFEASAEELEEAYAKIATENLTVEQIKTMLPEDSMRSDILTEKAMNYIKEIAAQPAEKAEEEKAEEPENKDAE